LNSLGEDDELYNTSGITIGAVRDNHIKGNFHVIPVEPARAELLRQKRELERKLADVNIRLAQFDVIVSD